MTLLELMVVVAILAVMSSVAIPAYSNYVRRSKTAEVYSHLHNLFRLTQTYYQLPLTVGPVIGSCTVISSATGWEPSDQRVHRQWDLDPSFAALKFTIGDPTRYVYELESQGSHCGNPPNSPVLYTLRARGDLDDDGEQSTFEMTAGSDPDNQLRRTPSVYVVEELE